MSNNIYAVIGGVKQEVPIEHFPGLKCQMTGDNNSVTIVDGFRFSNFSILINGNNNSVDIKIGADIKNTNIVMATAVNNRTVEIGKNFVCNGALITLPESGNSVTIGDSCMFSYGIQIRTEDGHAIFDIDSGELLNKGGKVIIGNHVWLGSNASVLKNTFINNDSIVSTGAIVTKRFSSPNVVLAGVPAKIIKTNVNWNIKSAEQYQAEYLASKKGNLF